MLAEGRAKTGIDRNIPVLSKSSEKKKRSDKTVHFRGDPGSHGRWLSRGGRIVLIKTCRRVCESAPFSPLGRRAERKKSPLGNGDNLWILFSRKTQFGHECCVKVQMVWILNGMML